MSIGKVSSFDFSVMQLNASPTLSTAVGPAAHKENWQQRRYNFLSKNSMFGGALKDELLEPTSTNEQAADVEQRYGNAYEVSSE